MSLQNSTSRTARTLWRDRGGNIAILFALILIPMIGMIGLAVDSARKYAVEQRLQESLDSAALAAGRNFSDTANRVQVIRDYFAANWRTGYLGAGTPNLTININDTTREVDVSATVNLPTIFMKIFGYNTMAVQTQAASISGLTYLEVALALDNTSSMSIVTGGQRRVDAMKTAATNFINTLYNGQETVPNMAVSLIPFTSMVNIGTQHSNFLVAGSTNNLLWDYPRNTTTQNSWRGCVFERSFYVEGSGYSGKDVTDDPPSSSGSGELFFPYHVPLMQAEAVTNCGVIGGAAPPPPSPYTPPPPPAQCIVDGVPVPCKMGVDALKPFARSSSLQLTPVSAALPSACPGTNPLNNDQGSPPVGWNSTDNEASPTRFLYRPAFTYTTPQGLVVHYPSRDGVASSGYNASVPALAANIVSSRCCAGSQPADTFNLVHFMSWPGYGAGSVSYSVRGWSTAGRWIAPWPDATNPKLGGWGNSGCGLPLLPLTETRTTILNQISAMDVPPQPSGNPANASPLGYSGTLINQGLVWAWRTVSQNWRGYWKNPNGTAINASLPRNFDTLGASKAVVIMTDGLNFLQDRWAFDAGGTAWYSFRSITLNYNDSNLIPSTDWGNMLWRDADSSAYGILRPSWEMDNHAVGTRSSSSLAFCRLRQATGFEPHLSTWGCREFDCMLRDGSNNCLRSATGGAPPGGGGYNYPAPPYDLQSALVGPYYDELTNRLLQTCANMRAQNIRIFFILFAIGANPQRAAAEAAFNTCVGAAGGVYSADDPTQLNNAFQQIAVRILNLRLTE